MATQYVLEPPSKGKVVLETTLGEIELEFWPKETPKACRNFFQLCLEGYYSGCVFHRVVKDFIAQTGDPTGTGDGGESVYADGPFADEFHQRLRFTRRGLLGMANSGPNSNTSQFFVTLAAARELDRKNTLFGKVVGDTIFNVLKANELELVPGTERPVNPPRITGTRVLANPFDDLQPRADPPWRRARLAQQVAQQSAAAAASAAARPARPPDRAKLSFADDLEPDALPAVRPPAPPPKQALPPPTPVHKAPAAVSAPAVPAATTPVPAAVSAEAFDEQMRARARERSKRLDSETQSAEEQQLREAIRAVGKPAEATSQGSVLEASRAKYLRERLSGAEKKRRVADRLAAFKNTLQSVKQTPAQPVSPPVDDPRKPADTEGDSEGEPVPEDWMQHELRFEKPELAKSRIDPMLKQVEPDDYVVYDPLAGKPPPARQPSRHAQRLNHANKKLDKW